MTLYGQYAWSNLFAPIRPKRISNFCILLKFLFILVLKRISHVAFLLNFISFNSQMFFYSLSIWARHIQACDTAALSQHALTILLASALLQVFNGSPSDGQLQRGDVIVSVDNRPIGNLYMNEAQDIIKECGLVLNLAIKRLLLLRMRAWQVSGSQTKPDNNRLFSRVEYRPLKGTGRAGPGKTA